MTACVVCGVEPVVRAIDDPNGLIPAGGRLALIVKDYVAAGEDIAVIAALPVDLAGAVLLVAEAMRQTCPDGVDFAMWCGAFLLAWELRAGRWRSCLSKPPFSTAPRAVSL